MTAQKQPKILIVGGASYLGIQLTRGLLSQNCLITVIDNRNEAEIREKFAEFSQSSDFKFVSADITQQLPQGLGKFSHIYHLAGIDEYLKEGQLTHQDLLVNSLGTENLLNLAKESGAKFILASTLDVYAGVISQTSLSNYFGPTSIDFNHFSHHEAKRFAESLTASYFQNFAIDCAIARIAQIYGPGVDLSSGGVITELINQAVKEENLKIPGDGLEILHPAYIDDVVWGLVKIGFGKSTQGGIYNLVGPETTVLEFANRLKEAFEEINQNKILEISFDKQEKPVKFPFPKLDFSKTEQDLGWKPKTTLPEGLKKTLNFFIDLRSQKTASVASEEETQPLEASKGKKLELPKISLNLPKFTLPTIFLAGRGKFFQTNYLILVLTLITLLLLVFPAGQVIYGVTTSFLNFKEARQALVATEWEAASQKSQQARTGSEIAAAGFQKLKPIAAIPGLNSWYENVNQSLTGITSGLSGFENLVAATQQTATLSKTVISKNGKVNNLNKQITELNLHFAQATTDFEQAKVFLDNSKFKSLPLLGDDFQNLTKQLEENLPQLKKAAEFVNLLPELLAIEGEKTYLVLFENNAELRPGGGFIGSYGVFKFKNGLMEQPLIDDVYNLDGRLPNPIPAPAPIAQNLGVDKTGLRDSNWHYDFAVNSQLAANLYNQATGEAVDGVIGIDVSAFSNLLEVLGPVDLPDYDEKVTAENLAERAEYYSEINFFPGSTSKKDFLGSLARQVILRLTSGEGANYFEVLKVFKQAADEKHLNLYFIDNKLQTFVLSLDWAGKITPIAIQDEQGQLKTISDYLAIFEANVGANKSNRFLERRVKVSPIILRDGDLITSLEINYKNASPAPTWPGGNYKNYLRVITPVGSKLEQVKISEQDVTTTVEQLSEGDKQIFGVFVEVPAGEERKINLVYRPNYRIDISGDKATYNFLVQKQPGTVSDEIEVDLAYPGYLTAQSSQPQADFSEQKVNFRQKLSTDLTFKVDFSL